jgi:hypothetical protein
VPRDRGASITPSPAPSDPAIQRSRSEGLLNPPPYLLDVDPDGTQRFRVLLMAFVWPRPHDPHHVGSGRSQVDPQAGEGPRTHARLLAEDSQKDVLGPDVAMPKRAGFDLGMDDDLTSRLGEALEHDR